MKLIFRQSALILPLFILLLAAATAPAQQVQLDRGFTYTAEALASGDERNEQEGLFVLEVRYKTLRMMYLDLTDPQTGKKSKQLIWYLAYKAINRPLEGQQDDAGQQPVNQFDKPYRQIFAPEFTLVTEDNGVQRVYQDEIIPEAQAAIVRRERQQFKNPVEVVAPIPDLTPFDATKDKEHAIYGVAIWRGIDPQTDYFTIYLSGFSNGYFYVKGPVNYQQLTQLAGTRELLPSDRVWDGKSDWTTAANLGGLFNQEIPPPDNVEDGSWFYTVDRERLGADALPPVWRKTLTLKYWSPGERFRQDETEVRPSGDPRWVYRISEPRGVATRPKDGDAFAPPEPPKAAP